MVVASGSKQLERLKCHFWHGGFRGQLRAGGAERLILDAILETYEAHSLVKARGKHRTDSSHVLAAIRTLNRLEMWAGRCAPR